METPANKTTTKSPARKPRKPATRKPEPTMIQHVTEAVNAIMTLVGIGKSIHKAATKNNRRRKS